MKDDRRPMPVTRPHGGMRYYPATAFRLNLTPAETLIVDLACSRIERVRRERQVRRALGELARIAQKRAADRAA